jgi:transcriptional regulator with GAF, ATPase, and Fis domain
VIDNATADDRFSGDPYIAAGSVRSLLCVPVSHQGRLGGILYLENDLTANAFTPQRAELMRILAAQAAISLENARLYADMAGEVERRAEAERALREALGEVEALKNRLQAENVYLQEEIQTQHNFTEIVGNSPALREALRKVERVAATGSTVLITGETGTGKEIIARAVHSRSTRRERPLVKVNCGAIPAGLVESELFGHVKGAFTGALQRRTGRFELADGGSIFLDEVGELPLETQVKLLRVLQEQEFELVGATRPVRVDVRVVAATNRDLESMVKAGTFRADLFYRLNVFPIAVPSLRDRRDDIPLLVAFFLSNLSKRLGKPLYGVTTSSLERMTDYSWPGNVRELQNVVERAAILAQGPLVDVPPELLPHTPAPVAAIGTGRAQTLEDVERNHILRVVRQTNWTIEGQHGAAVILGLHPNTLRSRMKKLGIARSNSEMS